MDFTDLKGKNVTVFSRKNFRFSGVVVDVSNGFLILDEEQKKKKVFILVNKKL